MVPGLYVQETKTVKLTFFLVGLSFSATASADPVTTYDWDISDWAFINACHYEGVRPYEGETIRAVVKFDTNGSIHLINRAAGHVKGWGAVTGADYEVNVMMQPVLSPPGEITWSMVNLNDDDPASWDGSVLIMVRHEIVEPGTGNVSITSFMLKGLLKDGEFTLVRSDPFESVCIGS